MDNLACHKSPTVRRAIEAAGARLWFLPKYSPDLNPIELAFANLTAILRTARYRTRDLLWATLSASLPRFEPTAGRHYLSALRLLGGYGVMKSALSRLPSGGKA